MIIKELNNIKCLSVIFFFIEAFKGLYEKRNLKVFIIFIKQNCL